MVSRFTTNSSSTGTGEESKPTVPHKINNYYLILNLRRFCTVVLDYSAVLTALIWKFDMTGHQKTNKTFDITMVDWRDFNFSWRYFWHWTVSPGGITSLPFKEGRIAWRREPRYPEEHWLPSTASNLEHTKVAPLRVRILRVSGFMPHHHP